MKKQILYIAILFLISSCKNDISNNRKQILVTRVLNQVVNTGVTKIDDGSELTIWGYDTLHSEITISTLNPYWKYEIKSIFVDDTLIIGKSHIN